MYINVRRFKYILGNKITKNFPRSLRSLEVKLHVYISFFHRIVCLDFNAFYIRMEMYKCMRAYAYMHSCVCACMHGCLEI